MARTALKPGQKNKGGRPPVVTLDTPITDVGPQGRPIPARHLLKMLGSVMCTEDEVASILGIDRTTLFRRFKEEPEWREIYENGKQTGKASLRRHQFMLAEKNATMAIFLGLNYLGQEDRRTMTGPNGGPIELTLRAVLDEIDALTRAKPLPMLDVTPGKETVA